MPSFYEKIKTLSEKTIKNNIWRQRESFNLIPSESTPSLLVKICEISDPAGRYAEHRTMKGEEVYFNSDTAWFIERHQPGDISPERDIVENTASDPEWMNQENDGSDSLPF